LFDIASILDRLVYWMPAVLVGLTFHEFAHGFVAEKLGDKTARHAGRLTLNPIAHIDPVGMLLLFVAGFGWAKPVPVNPYNIRGDRLKGLMLVSLAGPASNVLVALAGTVVLGIVGFNSVITPFLTPVILVNLILAFFNLLPVPPLDGSKILAGLFPGARGLLESLEQYGLIILLVLVFSGAIGALFRAVIFPVYAFLVQTAIGF
jgi:Zn-dependent protease